MEKNQNKTPELPLETQAALGRIKTQGFARGEQRLRKGGGSWWMRQAKKYAEQRKPENAALPPGDRE